MHVPEPSSSGQPAFRTATGLKGSWALQKDLSQLDLWIHNCLVFTLGLCPPTFNFLQ